MLQMHVIKRKNAVVIRTMTPAQCQAEAAKDLKTTNIPQLMRTSSYVQPKRFDPRR